MTANEGQQTDILSDVYLKYAEIINLQASAAFLGENLNVAAALDKAETNALTTDNKKSLADIYRAQAKFYGQNGRYEKAFRYSEKLQSITDSLYTTEQLRALEDMRTKYETTQKEQENELLLAKNELVNRQNQLYLGGLLAVLLAAFLLGFLYLKLRRTTEELALQKQKVEAQNIELQDLNQTKDRFFSIIAHDLRSPIAAFQGIGSQINYFVRKKAFDRLSELGNAINESSTQLNNLLDNLLNWAMSQTGKIPYRPKKLRAVEQIEEVAALLEGVSQAKNIQLSIDGDENHIVYADERAVNTVLRNLLTNAIKFSNNGDTIWLSTNKKDDYVVISVKDEGVGMTAEQVNQLFQVEKNSQKGTKGELGTGLGLVLVQELVQINDGKVEVRSELGKGTTFKVYLPQEAG
ncbi:MAG: HAMP domain-containing sensor histidine kinase [Bacteroidota bacterium]